MSELRVLISGIDSLGFDFETIYHFRVFSDIISYESLALILLFNYRGYGPPVPALGRGWPNRVCTQDEASQITSHEPDLKKKNKKRS
jgi:hypothetical protein